MFYRNIENIKGKPLWAYGNKVKFVRFQKSEKIIIQTNLRFKRNVETN